MEHLLSEVGIFTPKEGKLQGTFIPWNGIPFESNEDMKMCERIHFARRRSWWKYTLY